jgi:hypothetical protein
MSNNIEQQINGVVINIFNSEFSIASDELKNERMNVCNTCENKVNDSCKECSCLLVTRTSYVDSFCPIGKW